MIVDLFVGVCGAAAVSAADAVLSVMETCIKGPLKNM
jgi:hypothetical protein